MCVCVCIHGWNVLSIKLNELKINKIIKVYFEIFLNISILSKWGKKQDNFLILLWKNKRVVNWLTWNLFIYLILPSQMHGMK